MKRLVIILGGLLLSTPPLAITPEELARLSEKGAADKREVERQLNLNDLRYDVNVDAHNRHPSTAKKMSNMATPANNNTSLQTGASATGIESTQPMLGKTPLSTKYTPRAPHPQNVRNARRQENLYQPQRSASLSASSPNTKKLSRDTIYSDAVVPDTKRYYGIRRGTWIKAELRRNINNAEPGDVELYVSQDVHGDKKTLSIDTQLFAAKAFTSATQRLDMLTSYAITPRGREFVLKARIYDTHKVSGLIGIIDTDETKITARGTTQGLAALGSSVLGEVGGQSVIGQGLAKGGQSMINDAQRASQLGTQQQITIFVAPQPILLRVEETF